MSKKTITELTDTDREEIARLFKEGFTSGHLDNSEGKHINWDLTIEAWQDGDEE
jgi:hypothetical protein